MPFHLTWNGAEVCIKIAGSMCLHLLHLIFESTHKQAAWLFWAACFFARNDPAGSAICRHKLGHRRGSSCNYMNAVVPLAYTCRKLWKER